MQVQKIPGSPSVSERRKVKLKSPTIKKKSIILLQIFEIPQERQPAPIVKVGPSKFFID